MVFHRLRNLTLLACLALLGTKSTATGREVVSNEVATPDAATPTADDTTPDAASARVESAALSGEASSSSLEADPPKAAGGVVRVEERGNSRDLLPARIFTFPGDTLTAAASTGNPNTECPGVLYNCVNRCHSLFYKVTGGSGSNVTASTCGTTIASQYYYVWKGNDTCASFTCVEGRTFTCENGATGVTSWTAQAGAEYYVQVWFWGLGVPAAANYTLTVSSDAPIEVSKVDVCGTRHPPPPPTHAPTDAPTDAPMEVPTAPPTKAPTVTDPCAGVGTTYWLYDPKTNAPVRELINNSAACLLHPCNIEVRPCDADAAAAVSHAIRVRLLDASGGRPLVVYKSQPQRSAPYFLYGPAPTKGDVLPNPKPLRNGVYYVAAKGAPEWGRLRFTQKCPCPDGTKKGKKGCMMM